MYVPEYRTRLYGYHCQEFGCDLSCRPAAALVVTMIWLAPSARRTRRQRAAGRAIDSTAPSTAYPYGDMVAQLAAMCRGMRGQAVAPCFSRRPIDPIRLQYAFYITTIGKTPIAALTDFPHPLLVIIPRRPSSMSLVINSSSWMYGDNVNDNDYSGAPLTGSLKSARSTSVTAPDLLSSLVMASTQHRQ